MGGPAIEDKLQEGVRLQNLQRLTKEAHQEHLDRMAELEDRHDDEAVEAEEASRAQLRADMTRLKRLPDTELMLNSVNVMLLAFNRTYPSNHDGQVFAFFVIAVAAAEAALGLAILIAYYRIKKTVNTDDATLLRH